MKLTTAGESHGKTLVGILEGVPANLIIDEEEMNYYLALRQSGYGRGGRQKIEKDKVEILSGVRNRLTLGSPLAFCINNADYANWEEIMSAQDAEVTQRTLTRVRPGHADLTGAIKFGQTDARNVLERASARETATRVAGGTVARQFLKELGIEVCGFVKSVCGVSDGKKYTFEELKEAKKQPLFMLDEGVQNRAMLKVDEARKEGDTVGGIIELRVQGLKSGFGSCMTYFQKLDAVLCGALMSVQAIKGVEVGLGFEAANLNGSAVHDEIFYENGKFVRKSNNAGGIEGGMSNGEQLVLRAAMKPIPTLMKGLRTVDLSTKEACVSASERSDVCAVCACEIILESVLCLALSEVVSSRLGGDTMKEVKERYALLP